MTDDKDRNDTGKTGGKPSTDLEQLKARLGLKKSPGAAAPGPVPPRGTTPAAPTDAPRRPSADDFKFAFGGREGGGEALTEKDLAAIEAEASKAATPLGRKVLLASITVLGLVLALWLGYQFGNSMGLRALHNEAVVQAGDIKDFFLKSFTDGSGRELSARRDATMAFNENLEAYSTEHFNAINGLKEALSSGEIPPGFNEEEWKKWKSEHLDPLKKMCENYLTNVEEYNMGALLKGQLYSTDLGAKLLDFTEKANRMRGRVDALFVAIQMLEEQVLLPPAPSSLAPEELVMASKTEDEKDKVIKVVAVEKDGEPEVDREIVTKEVCEPVSMELEIPTDIVDGELKFEKKLIDTFDRKQVQEVHPFRKLKVKGKADGKSVVSRMESLFIMDLRPYLMPLVEQIQTNKRIEAENLGLLMTVMVQAMLDVQRSAEEADFRGVVESIDKYAQQELMFTL